MRNLNSWAPKFGGQWPPKRAGSYRQAEAPKGWEVVRWTLYDRVIYGNVSRTIYFFSGGNPTKSVSNMTLAGKLPESQEFLIESAEVAILVGQGAGSNIATFGSYTNPGTLRTAYNAFYNMLKDGRLTLTIGTKPYINGVPLVRFAPQCRYRLNAAFSDASTPAGNQNAYTHLFRQVGDPYTLTPTPLLLARDQSLQVSIAWPSTIASGTNNTISVYLRGLLYRKSQ